MKGADRMKCHRVWVLIICACGFAANASAQLITETIKDDWPSYNGDYSGRRFSSLTQITPQNAAHLQAQWVFHTKTPGILEGTPVVVNGIMYFTGSNDVFALNAQTGEQPESCYGTMRDRFRAASSMMPPVTLIAVWPYQAPGCTWKPTMLT
jgi:hypothetical protein